MGNTSHFQWHIVKVLSIMIYDMAKFRLKSHYAVVVGRYISYYWSGPICPYIVNYPLYLPFQPIKSEQGKPRGQLLARCWASVLDSERIMMPSQNDTSISLPMIVYPHNVSLLSASASWLDQRYDRWRRSLKACLNWGSLGPHFVMVIRGLMLT